MKPGQLRFTSCDRTNPDNDGHIAIGLDCKLEVMQTDGTWLEIPRIISVKIDEFNTEPRCPEMTIKLYMSNVEVRTSA